MIEMMMTAMTVILGLGYAGAFKGRSVNKFKTKEFDMPAAVQPPKGEVKGGIVFLSPVWEEESLEEMEGRIVNNLMAEGVKTWPKIASPRWVYMPRLKAVPVKVAFTKETPKPVWLPALT